MWESRREWEQLASGASEPARAWTLGTVTASYYRITSKQPGSQAVVIIGHNAATIMGTALCALTNLPELWKHPLKNNAYPPKSKLLAVC